MYDGKPTSFPAFLCVFFVIVFLSLSIVVNAQPITQSSEKHISITLRAHRAPTGSDIHPSIIQQQHANNGIKRLALMTGSHEPSIHQLLANINQRISGLPEDLQQRYNQRGIAELLRQLVGPSVSTPSLHAFTNADSQVKKPDLAINFPNTIGLNIQSNDIGYFGIFKIGSPPSEFHLLIDTGSADLWVGGEGCRGDDGGQCGNHTFLGPSHSSTFKDLGQDWAMGYNTGSVSGHMVEDIISIAGLHLLRYKFGMALNESSDFTSDDIPFDGIAGFAKSDAVAQDTAPLLDSLFAAGLIKKPIASYLIPRLADGRDNGELTLGSMNPSRYKKQSLVTVKNVNKFGFWSVPIGAVKVNGHNMGLENRTALLDTGTTLIIAPKPDVDAIHHAIPGAQFSSGGWTIPCTTNVSLSLTIGGMEFQIDKRDLAFLPVDSENPTGGCISGIAQGNVGPFNLPTDWLVGDVFLKNVYFSTNSAPGKDEISLAKLAAS